MVKRFILPLEALDDIRGLVRLSSDQLVALETLFSSGKSVSAHRATFINQVAEKLRISIEDARSVSVVCSFLLSAVDDNEAGDVGELLEDVREFLKDSLTEDERQTILNEFDEKRTVLVSLATPKPARLRAEKIRRLLGGPEPHVHSFRTVCQIRPLFEGPENNETIVGLVPMILLEIESVNADGITNTLSFSMDADDLKELEKLVKRTNMKLEAIQEKYNSEILAAE